MRSLIWILIIFIFYSCNTSRDKEYLINIQGDWISDQDFVDYQQRRLFLSILDTNCTFLYAWNYNCTFRIEDEILTIKEIEPVKSLVSIHQFRILQLTNDTLRIAVANKGTKDRLNGNEIIDSILFIKAKYKNSIEPRLITFFSSDCYGSCPSFVVEIDSSKKVIFYGNNEYSLLRGGCSGIIRNTDYIGLLNKIHYLDINQIDSSYKASWTDDQHCLIVIDYDDKRLESSVYGFNKEPIELRMLFGEIFKVAEMLEIVNDTTVDFSTFKHNPVFLSFYPPPPGPLPEKAKFLEPVLRKKNITDIKKHSP